MSKSAENWSVREVELIIADYFAMYSAELLSLPYSKTEHRIRLKSILENRSDGSIEFKHQNISAVLIKMDLPFIKGYKPKWNYQALLQEKVLEYLTENEKIIEPQLIQFSEMIVSKTISTDLIVESPPEPAPAVQNIPNIDFKRKPFKINYLEHEQRNTSLGLKGEELVMDYEAKRLFLLGRSDLVNGIEWISRFDDGAGFDILSKNEDGSDRYIEVKTTKLSKETPIFFSKTEYHFSIKYRNQFNLYRLFNFHDQPKMFNIQGSFDDFCIKEASQYKGMF